MQYLKITKDTTLSSLSSIVGERNVDYVLNANGLSRSVNVGKQFASRNAEILASSPTDVDYQTKIQILNQFVGDSDIYEKAALCTEDEWKLLSAANYFADAIRIPIEVQLPESEDIIGNHEPILDKIYTACMSGLKGESHTIDPGIFAEYSTSTSNSYFSVTSSGESNSQEFLEWFLIPWGAVCLYSSLGDELLYFPVYPEIIDDGVSANYEEMSEMLYQYEPWKVYKSSGPREITFSFKFHRDMWTGDHRDGNANALIRSCEANCYPKYNGSLVNTSLVTLYLEGENFITGVMTSCKKHWDGPIGLDGYYLMCELTFTIVEVSPQALNYDTVKEKGLIG